MGRKNVPTDVFQHIDMNPIHPNTCWLWTAGVNGKGIPYFQVDGKKIIAYRLVYKLTHDEWDIDNSRELICHQCKDANGIAVDNPLCCHPDHMKPGTHLDNMLEMASRGRTGLTIDALRDILMLREQFPQLTQGQIADRVSFKHKISVSRQAVTDLLRGARHQALKNELDKRERDLEESGNG